MNQFETVESYIQSFDGNTKEHLQELRLIIHEVVPETDELINYNIAALRWLKVEKEKNRS